MYTFDFETFNKSKNCVTNFQIVCYRFAENVYDWHYFWKFFFEHFETGFPDVSVTLEVSQLKSRDNTFKAELCASKVNPSKH